MWNWRLLLVTGEAVYAELMERTLYNGFLSSTGFDGTSFFYFNPLQYREPATRQAWYDCACCPPNIMRLLASLEHYVATQTVDGVQVHQYLPCRIRTERGNSGALELVVTTGYPFDGTVVIRVVAAPTDSQEIALRVPTWAREARCTLNGRRVTVEPCEKGYLRIRQEWSAADEIVLELPMRAHGVGAASEIDAVRGCVAFERGPLVYCLEGIDLPKGVNLQTVSVDASVRPEEERGFAIGSESVVALRLRGRTVSSWSGWPYGELDANSTGGVSIANGIESRERAIKMRAVPYYAWGNRGPTPMRVWIPTEPGPTQQDSYQLADRGAPID